MIGKIRRVELREVFKHEATNFTKWLEENIDVLNEVLELNLSNVEREQSAGTFNADLVAEDGNGNLVVIENQLEKSNHDHLGKLITYLTTLDATSGIWIVSEPRPEHVKAVSWLNEASGASFFLLKIEAIQIGDSPPAALLTLIVGPSDEAAEAGITKKEMAERFVIRRRFWEGLLDVSKKKTKLHSGISAGHHNWLGTGAGIRGIAFNYTIRQHDGQVELYIDQGKESGEGNQAIFDALDQRREKIEQDFGAELEWDGLEQKRACRIRKTVKVGGWRDEEKWTEAHEALVDTMIRFEKALRPHLQQLKNDGLDED